MQENVVITLAEIDQGIWKVIADEAVRKNAFVHPLPFVVSGDNAAYRAAIDAIKMAGIYVDVKPPGSRPERGENINANITIDRQDIERTGIGYSVSEEIQQYDDMGTTKFRRADITNPHHVEYEIRVTADTIESERFANQIILNALKERNYIRGIRFENNVYVDSETSFLFQTLGTSVDLSTALQQERLWRYQAYYVHIAEDIITELDISQITSIDMEMQAVKTFTEFDVNDPSTWLDDDLIEQSITQTP